MNSTLDYIEDYFIGKFSDEEKKKFEIRCMNDPAFAREVSFYITARDVLKEELIGQKRKEFGELHKQLSSKTHRAIPIYKKLSPYIAAAASILLFIVYIAFLKNPSARQLADNFVKEELTVLPVTMGNEQDSLALGITAFNTQDYLTAEKIFYTLSQKEPSNTDALEYLGKTYLVSGQYDKANATFDTLLSRPDLKANPGKFYKAVSLMMRSNDKDVEEAKKLLQEVAENNLPGSKEAAKWLKDL